MGAWIEIQVKQNLCVFTKVAPLVGAWIEIIDMMEKIRRMKVAPLVGAWIEIIYIIYICRAGVSLLSWERGLKCIYLF